MTTQEESPSLPQNERRFLGFIPTDVDDEELDQIVESMKEKAKEEPEFDTAEGNEPS